MPVVANDLVDGRFYSARDWGYGGARIDESLNRLTFVRAIEQYNTCTFDGKRRAYVMLGHVVHLLQDQGQPDHARLVAHPGSSMDEVEAYSAYHYCEFLAAEAAAAAALACFGPWSPACAAAAFGVAEAACWASASSQVVGFERLIGAPIEGTTFWQLSDVDADIDAQGVVSDPPSTYDGYFKTMSDLSTSEATNRGLDSALGCETLVLIPPIPDADPAIDTTTADPAPHLALTKVLVPKIVGLSAGLMRHFYDIVNHPPILERLTVVQWQPGARPQAFGVLDRTAPDHCTRYDGRWILGGGHRVLTMLHPRQELSLDRPAYVFLLFGPIKDGDVPEVGRRMSRVECVVHGRNLSTGQDFHQPLHLQGEVDPTEAFYYWGSFQPHNCAPDPYQITFEVSGQDSAAHLVGRPGAELDADPSTLATVDPTDPQFGWRDYTPGADLHHTIIVSSATWRVEATPQQLTLSTRSRHDRVGTFTLQVTEEELDCHQEPYWALTRCPVAWSLQPDIVAVASGSSHPPEDVGLTVELRREPNQSAVVTVEVTQRFVHLHRVDRFKVFVDHTIGEGNHLVAGTTALDLSIE